MKQDLDVEKERRIEASSALEREKIAVSSTSRDLELEKEQHKSTDAKFGVKIADLRQQFETEKAHSADLTRCVILQPIHQYKLYW